MGKTHELKCWPEYYKLVTSGLKDFELRLDDRNFEEGDTVILKEWNPVTKQYTNHEHIRKIVYVFRDEEMGLKRDYVILQLNNLYKEII